MHLSTSLRTPLKLLMHALLLLSQSSASHSKSFSAQALFQRTSRINSLLLMPSSVTSSRFCFSFFLNLFLYSIFLNSFFFSFFYLLNFRKNSASRPCITKSWIKSFAVSFVPTWTNSSLVLHPRTLTIWPSVLPTVFHVTNWNSHPTRLTLWLSKLSLCSTTLIRKSTPTPCVFANGSDGISPNSPRSSLTTLSTARSFSLLVCVCVCGVCVFIFNAFCKFIKKNLMINMSIGTSLSSLDDRMRNCLCWFFYL